MKFDFPELLNSLDGGMAAGLHIGAVVHVRHHGVVVADFAVGAASVSPVTPLRTNQRLLWLSAGKPLTAMAIGILSDRGKISLDTPVCEFISAFARHDKDAITVRHLLTHTHAFNPPRLDWPRLSREDIVEQICAAQLIEGATPGQYAAYDPQTGWYLLSEIIERVTGQVHDKFVKAQVLEPLGCSQASIGMTADEWTFARDSGELAVMHDTTRTARKKLDLTPAAFTTEGSEVHTWPGDDAQRSAAHNPGGGALGTASDLSAIYQCLLDQGLTPEGTVLLRPSTVKEMTSRQRTGLKDHSFGQGVDWGLGFLVNSARYGASVNPYGYGRFASDATFGHGGMQSSSAYADPDNGLAVAILFNGLPGEPKHQKRVGEVNSALYRDLGLDRGKG